VDLIEGHVPPTGISGERADHYTAALGQLAGYVGRDRLPVVRLVDGSVLHFTFAGRLINSVIARWAGLEEFNASEVTLRCGRQLDLTDLPANPGDLQDLAADYLSRPLTLTVFQQLLPPEVLVRELIDIWHKAPVYGRHLERLREAAPIDADPQVMTRIAW
jgi:ATP-dependent Lhr-like helicase